MPVPKLNPVSREASENSQDDEQFRAKREFLKSGLPESFKKQIAKTAASREAYSQACASFQTVVHVQQRAAGKLTGVLLAGTYNDFSVYVFETNVFISFHVRLFCLEHPVAYKSLPYLLKGVL